MESPPPAAPAHVADVPLGLSSYLPTSLLSPFSTFLPQPITFLPIILLVLPLCVLLLLPSSPQPPSSPPRVHHRVPLLGHIPYLLTCPGKHFARLARQYPPSTHPILELPLPGGRRIYVVQTLSLQNQCLRANRALSFDPFVETFVKQLYLTGGEDAAKTAEQKIFVPGFLETFTRTMAAGMAGENLRAANRGVLREVAMVVGGLARGRDESGHGKGEGEVIDNFWVWIRDELGSCTLNALYGAQSPFRGEKGKEALQALWDWDTHLSCLILPPPLLAPLVCPTGCRARVALREAFTPYFNAGHHTSPSLAPIIRNRMAAFAQFGWTTAEMALTEMSMTVASVQNATPSCFWVVQHVLSRQEWTARVRAEVEAIATTTTQEGGGKVLTFDTKQLESKAPFLCAAYFEMLRFYQGTSHTRRVMSDVQIGDYVLREGADVMMPAERPHHDPQVYGEDHDVFNPERFFSRSSGGQVDEGTLKKRHAGLLPFGGGKHLCPGRKLAFAEILGLAAVLITGFEYEWLGAQGGKKDARLAAVPEGMDPGVVAGIKKPQDKPGTLRVKVTRRKGWEDVKWKFVC